MEHKFEGLDHDAIMRLVGDDLVLANDALSLLNRAHGLKDNGHIASCAHDAYVYLDMFSRNEPPWDDREKNRRELTTQLAKLRVALEPIEKKPDGNVHTLRQVSYKPSSQMLALADLFEHNAKAIREGKIIAGSMVTVDADSYEISVQSNYDARGMSLLGGATRLVHNLNKMLDE